MKKIIALVILLIFFLLPVFPYPDCSLSLPPPNPPADWVNSCPKKNVTIFHWIVDKVRNN